MTRIAAHLIVGAFEEVFLPGLLRSLEGVADTLVVNDNGGDPAGPNARALAASAFARRSALFVDCAAFTDFSCARNRVLDLHRRLGLGEWAAFVDADEVHRPRARVIAANLDRLPGNVAVIDGYTRHYFQSFGLYTSIARRMSFFRVTPDLQWAGSVHEQLEGIGGRRLAIPYVYDHYGALVPIERHAAKGRLYASLGQSGPTVSADAAATLDAGAYFRGLWPRALRYDGDHPAIIDDLRRMLESSDGERFRWSELRAAHVQTPRARALNAIRRANFELRWRGRALDPLAARLLREPPAVPSGRNPTRS